MIAGRRTPDSPMADSLSVAAFVRDVRAHLRTRRASRRRKRCVVLTAPHAADRHNPIDDPCTGAVTRRLETAVPAALGVPCRAFVATTSRVYGDQNRLHTLLARPAVREVAIDLLAWARGRDDGVLLADALHLDIHSYTATDDDYEPGWTRGAVNLIHLKGDESQRAVAWRLKRSLDASFCGLLPAASVIEHPRLPLGKDRDESNAMIEIGRHLGAASVLVELPTVRIGEGYALYGVSESLVVEALVDGVRRELEAQRGGAVLNEPDVRSGHDRPVIGVETL